MGGFFKGKKPSVETKVIDLPAYRNVRNQLGTVLQGNLSNAAPSYGNQRVAELTPEQQAQLSRINQWAGQPNQVMQNATNMLNKTMTGGFNPNTSQWYQGMRGAMQENLSNSLNSIANRAAGGGRYWAGARLGEQRKAATNMANSLNQNLGQMALQERQMAMNALPYAQGIANYPYAQNMRALQANEMARGIEQQKLGTAYEDWYNQNYRYPQQQVSNALQFVQGEPIKFQTIKHGGSSSPFSKIAGAAIGALTGGPIGAAAGLAGGLGGGGGTGGLLGGLAGGWATNLAGLTKGIAGQNWNQNYLNKYFSKI